MEMALETINRMMRDCALCPRRCHADRTSGKTGFCGEGAEVAAVFEIGRASCRERV